MATGRRHIEGTPPPPLTGASVPQTVYAVPILTFAFVCHPSILPMYEELKE